MSLSNCRGQSACAESCCQWTRWKVKPSCWENWNLDNLGQISWMESLYFHSHLILFNSPILVHHASSCSDPAQVCPADLGDDELAGRVAVGWTWQWTVHRKIVDFPTKTSIYRGFSIAKLKNKSVYRCIYCILYIFFWLVAMCWLDCSISVGCRPSQGSILQLRPFRSLHEHPAWPALVSDAGW